MKEFLTDTLELNKFLEYDLLLKNEHILKKPSKENLSKKRVWKNPVFRSNDKLRASSEFSSLERIRIVVDGLLGDLSVERICNEERISEDTFFEWKNDFLEAFKKHSEDVLIHEKLSLTSKELILKDATSFSETLWMINL